MESKQGASSKLTDQDVTIKRNVLEREYVETFAALTSAQIGERTLQRAHIAGPKPEIERDLGQLQSQIKLFSQKLGVIKDEYDSLPPVEDKPTQTN